MTYREFITKLLLRWCDAVGNTMEGSTTVDVDTPIFITSTTNEPLRIIRNKYKDKWTPRLRVCNMCARRKKADPTSCFTLDVCTVHNSILASCISSVDRQEGLINTCKYFKKIKK